jgi:hypothetical protein
MDSLDVIKSPKVGDIFGTLLDSSFVVVALAVCAVLAKGRRGYEPASVKSPPYHCVRLSRRVCTVAQATSPRRATRYFVLHLVLWSPQSLQNIVSGLHFSAALRDEPLQQGFAGCCNAASSVIANDSNNRQLPSHT